MYCGQKPDAPAQKTAGRPAFMWARGLWRGRPEQSGRASLWQRLLIEVACDGLARTSLATLRSKEPVVHPTGRNSPEEVRHFSSRSWPNGLFVESHSHRRVGLFCRRIQVPVSVSEEFLVSAKGVRSEWEPGEKDFVEIGCVGVSKSFRELGRKIVEGSELSAKHWSRTSPCKSPVLCASPRVS